MATYTPYITKIRGTNGSDYYLRDAELYSTTITEWVAGSTYSVGKIVDYDGKPYICIAATSSSDTNTPASDTTHWEASTNLADIVASIEAQASTTDEKLKVSAITIANLGTTYYPVLAANGQLSTAMTRQVDSEAFKYKFESASNIAGNVTLELGNDVAQMTSKFTGKLTLHSGSTIGSVTLYGQSTTTASYAITGDSTTSTGYIAVKLGNAQLGSATKPVYVAANGVLTACNDYPTVPTTATSHTTGITVAAHGTTSIKQFSTGGSFTAVPGTTENDAHTLIYTFTAATGSNVTVVTGSTHTVTDNGHTHTLS